MRPITVSTTGVGQSAPVRFDDYGDPQVSLQCNVTGAATYTVQQSLDDPNSPINPVDVASMAWTNHPDVTLVNATTSLQGNYAYKPTFARINQTAGAGSVTATFIQAGGADYGA
jgi:hypothetical protein